MHVALLARQSLNRQPGGDTVQIQQTALALEQLGYRVSIVLAGDPLPEGVDVLHFFNLGRPADAFPYFLEFEGPKVISSIYVDYSAADRERMPWAFRLVGAHGLEYLKTLARGRNGTDRKPPLRYVLSGQKRSIRLLVQRADLVVTSSTSELERICALKLTLSGKALRDKHRVLPLGLHPDFLHTPPTYQGARSGLLLVGRLEYLKNQLQVIHWARENQWPLTVVGDANTNQPEYAEQCRLAAGPETTFLPYQGSEALIKVMDRHKTLIIPSHFETFSLVGLEAYARGMSVLINDVPDMRETLAQVAQAVSFRDAEAVKAAVEDHLGPTFWGIKKSQAGLEAHAWDRIASRLADEYRRLLLA